MRKIHNCIFQIQISPWRAALTKKLFWTFLLQISQLKNHQNFTKHTKIIKIFVRYFERQNAIRGKMPRAPILCLPRGFHSLSGHARQIKPGSCETIATAIKLPPQRNATKRIFICLSKYIDQKRYCTVSNTRSHKKPPAWRITSKKWSSSTYLKYFTLERKSFT